MTSRSEEAGPGGAKAAGFDPELIEPYVVKDPQALTLNVAKALENLGKAASSWLAPSGMRARETSRACSPKESESATAPAGV